MIPKRPLGATGEELSIIGIAGWDVAAASSESESIAIMHEAIDAGINLWQFHAIKRDSDPGLIYDLESGAMRAAMEARAAGKIRSIIFTGHASPRFHLAMLDLDFTWDAVQMPTNGGTSSACRSRTRVTGT